jgi:hypothetical protein
MLDSRMMVTGPPLSFGITTAVLGLKLVEVVVWIVQNTIPKPPLL